MMKKKALRRFRRMRDSLTAQRESISARLAAIDGALGVTVQSGTPVITRAEAAPPRAEPWRGRVAATQRERLARVRQTTKQPTKRRISSAGRARIAAAQRERWARQREASSAPATKGSSPRKPGARHL